MSTAIFASPEILVKESGTKFITIEIITISSLYDIKQKPRSSHDSLTNGLVEVLNRSLQKILQ